MPQDRANASELLAGVEAFLNREVLPQLSGASSYKCRVAASILRIVERELVLGDRADRCELEGLQNLLGHTAVDETMPVALDSLNAELCSKIRSGEMDDQREAVAQHVRETVQAKLAIANPKYPGYRESLSEQD